MNSRYREAVIILCGEEAIEKEVDKLCEYINKAESTSEAFTRVLDAQGSCCYLLGYDYTFKCAGINRALEIMNDGKYRTRCETQKMYYYYQRLNKIKCE